MFLVSTEKYGTLSIYDIVSWRLNVLVVANSGTKVKFSIETTLTEIKPTNIFF